MGWTCEVHTFHDPKSDDPDIVYMVLDGPAAAGGKNSRRLVRSPSSGKALSIKSELAEAAAYAITAAVSECMLKGRTRGALFGKDNVRVRVQYVPTHDRVRVTITNNKATQIQWRKKRDLANLGEVILDALQSASNPWGVGAYLNDDQVEQLHLGACLTMECEAEVMREQGYVEGSRPCKAPRQEEARHVDRAPTPPNPTGPSTAHTPSGFAERDPNLPGAISASGNAVAGSG